MKGIKNYLFQHKGIRLILWIILFGFILFMLIYIFSPFINLTKNISYSRDNLINSIYSTNDDKHLLTFENETVILSEFKDDYYVSQRYKFDVKEGCLYLTNDEYINNEYLIYSETLLWDLNLKTYLKRITNV